MKKFEKIFCATFLYFVTVNNLLENILKRRLAAKNKTKYNKCLVFLFLWIFESCIVYKIHRQTLSVGLSVAKDL